MDIDLSGKILVADDEKVNVEFFHIMLERLGFEVEIAYNGEEVIKKVETFYPDIILLDLLMPKMSGIEVTRILKSKPETSNIPIIVLTAIDDIKEKVDLFEIGIEDYITKPFNFIEILARIRGILKTRRFKQIATAHEKKIELLEKYFKEFEKLESKLRKFVGNYDKKFEQEHNLNSDQMKVIFDSLIDELRELDSGLSDLREKIREIIKTT